MVEEATDSQDEKATEISAEDAQLAPLIPLGKVRLNGNFLSGEVGSDKRLYPNPMTADYVSKTGKPCASGNLFYGAVGSDTELPRSPLDFVYDGRAVLPGVMDKNKKR